MKKSIILTSAIACISLLGTTTYAIVDNTTPAESTDTTPILVATTELGTTTTSVNTNKDETVFTITDSAGSVKTTYIGSTLYTGSESLPVSLDISYTLNGNPIAPADLVGKSGHIGITFTPTTTATHNDTLVPFIAITGVSLNSADFSNIKISHGKIITTTDDTTIIAGYSIAGLSSNLGTDLLPASFSLTADTTNFSLGTTYTIFTNDVLADLDTSKLSTVDDIVNAINTLSSSMDQIVAGSEKLTDGLKSAYDGSTQLAAGANDLANGAYALSAGAAELSAGLAKIESVDDTVVEKVKSLIPDDLEEKKATLEELIAKISEETDIDTTPLTDALATLETRITEVKTAALEYVNGIKALSTGARELATGSQTLADGATALKSGISVLSSGLGELYTGSTTLTDGLATFKTSGTDRLADFANTNLADFTNKLRRSVTAARGYHSFSNPTARTVKFIFKTPSLK